MFATVPAPAHAAVPLISVTSSPTGSVKITGTGGNDKIVLTRAGTASAPLVNVDAASALSILTGCQPVAGDPTRALCAAPIASGSTLRPVLISAGAGDDLVAHGTSLPIPMIVSGSVGRDTINGGPGQDSLSGGTDNDVLRSGDGTDSLNAGSGDDLLDGGPGRDDDLYGGTGNDQLLGGDGDSDDLDGGPGADSFDGGAGRNDIVMYDGRFDDVSADLSSTTAINGETDEQDLFKTGIENLMGGRGNTLNIGGPGNVPNADGVSDFIGGQDGNDTCIRSAADGESPTECETVLTDG